MSGNNTNAVIYEENGTRPLAQVVLNGYNIAAGGPLGRSGAMRSFKIVEGELWEQWNRGVSLQVRAEDGRVARARIAAHPAEEGAAGFIEFL